MKIGFAYSKKKLSGWLTKLFTGSFAYHVFIVDEENGKMYDMHLLLRRRKWPHYDENTEIKLVESPVAISSEYMEHLIETSDDVYGWKDYLLFGMRPIYHLFGMSTRNKDGVICSEMVYNVLRTHGWPVKFTEVPSPADLELFLLKE